MEENKSNIKNTRRDFIKKSAMGAAGITIGAMGFPAKSYARIIGANDRMNVALIGLGRRYGAYLPPIGNKDNNVNLKYICDVMDSQLENASENIKKRLGIKPKPEKDMMKIFDDNEVDAVFIATPDHWHTPAAIMALQRGKHVYVEKPISHNPYEGELLVEAKKRYGKVVQMGNQQRSSIESQEVIKAIHEGAIGNPYLAVAFYTNSRGRTPNQTVQAPPKGLDWEMWQGPAVHREYTHDTWNYNWHWYGWNYGTAETGNNALHELDIARWALKVGIPDEVYVEAKKQHFPDDGWEMYDTMEATFKYGDDKIIKWDGKSRNGYVTYRGGRGTIIYGSEGSVFVNRGGYRIFDRKGKLVKDSSAATQEAGTALGGGGDLSTRHVNNFFDVVRGKSTKQSSPVEEGVTSTLLCHLANISYRMDSKLRLNRTNGHIMNNNQAMQLWRREYESGWEPKI
ncbi:MAG: Gfo/Idh/MocA family oxidoreductase [Chlorobi bacterium]|nr:Gfo/Idh/MocA family oxidoreductase [Chlorobiota bacterium]